MLNHNWVKFSASPAANTNQIFIEDVLQVVMKVTKSVKSTSGEITKNSGEKHAYVQGGVSNYRGR